MREKIKELTSSQLYSEADPSVYDFNTTDDIAPREDVVGQKRALRAIDLGLNMKNGGYNLYISGPSGTGRTTTILNAVNELAAREPKPCDICYLYNFQEQDEPKGLCLPGGMGKELEKDMNGFIKDIQGSIQRAFISEDYEKHKKKVLDKFERRKDRLNEDLANFALSKETVLKQTLTGIVAVPVKNDRPLSEREYQNLKEEEKRSIEQNRNQVHEKLFAMSPRLREIERQAKTEVEKLDKEVGLYAIGGHIEDLKNKYKDFDLLKKHFDDIQNDILSHLEDFGEEQKGALAFIPQASGKDKLLQRYKVNLLVDNSNAKGAPVVTEYTPNYYNLIGYVEYQAQMGLLTTDFTMIKPGAVHKANGGYLVLHALNLLRDYFAWDSLKKILRHKVVKIENLAQRYGIVPTTGLKPKPMPVDLKVIIVGFPLFYHLLYQYDEDFRKLFKIKADFDTSVKRSDETVSAYIAFIAHICKSDKLIAFSRDAVRSLVKYSSRKVSHKDKLSTRFIEISDVMHEAEYWAKKDNVDLVGKDQVLKALDEKVYRSNMIEEKIDDMIEENTIFVDTKGSRIGQINGLSILDLGDYMFGKPSRITASTYAGRGDVINIERETKLSGKIHSKGVLILTGYLGSEFAQNKHLALGASICFEQVYEEVDGDSASSTELYCLLSSLSGVPLRQDIAVTGSVDQQGNIQPVGGINEKIEGFYQVCKIKGLTGTQGVIMPDSNVKHLMLKEEVVQAVEKKIFHIYPVKYIRDGIEILTGMKAGEKNADGSFEKGSVFEKADSKLRQYSRIALPYKKKQKEGLPESQARSRRWKSKAERLKTGK